MLFWEEKRTTKLIVYRQKTSYIYSFFTEREGVTQKSCIEYINFKTLGKKKFFEIKKKTTVVL